MLKCLSFAPYLFLNGFHFLLQITYTAVEDAGLSLTIFEDLSVACDELADLTAEVGGLGGDASAFAECLGEGRKRATGRLRLAITLSQTPPKGCLKSSSCRRLQVLILSFKARAVISKAKAGHIKINVTDTKTSEVTEVQLSGSLKPVSNTVQRTCAPGTVLNVYTCGEFRWVCMYLHYNIIIIIIPNVCHKSNRESMMIYCVWKYNYNEYALHVSVVLFGISAQADAEMLLPIILNDYTCFSSTSQLVR